MRSGWLDAMAIRRTDLTVSRESPILCISTDGDVPWGTAFEFHYPVELGILLSGRMARIFPDQERTLEPGEVWLCGMWEPHAYRIIDRPCQRLSLIIHPTLLADTRFDEYTGHNWLLPFSVPPAYRPQFAEPYRASMLEVAERFRAIADHPGPQCQVRLRLLLLEVLLDLTRTWQPPKGSAAPADDDFGRVRQAIDAVFATRKRINTEDAAKLCGLSSNRFSDMFRRVTGITFADFALRHRLSGAARQLVTSGDSLKAIAEEWGFTDVSHLCRAFQAQYGVAPTTYRRHHGGSEAAVDARG